jgi:RecB family exonuclease
MLFSERLDAERRRRPLGEVTWPVADAPTAAERERALRAARPAEALRHIAPVSDAGALAELRSRPPVSAGALEAYASCPAKWLVDRVLRARGIDPDAQPLARGSFAHDVLERTLTRLSEEVGSARVTPETLPAAERLLDETVAEVHAGEAHLLARTSTEALGVAHRVQVQLHELLRHEARGASDFEPVDLELSFGFEDEESLPPLRLGDGTVEVRGRIDRVDVSRRSGRAIVRDYKSGEASSEHSEASWGEAGQLQVGLYMLAVQRECAREVVGGVYQSLRGSNLRARGLLMDVPEVRALAESTMWKPDLREPEVFAASLTAVEEAAVELARGMHSGRVEPCPDTCGYGGRGGCVFPGICRSEGT